MTVYLDCNATTPTEPVVQEIVIRFLTEEFGNAGSRTHAYGARAKRAVEKAREQIAAVVGAKREEVVFTSGATESNNLALLGMAAYGESQGRRHIVAAAIEHKAVLEPLQELRRRGFEVTLVAPEATGRVNPEAMLQEVREDTLLVSMMHVNNETGVVQPIEEVCEGLAEHAAYFHTDAAQGFCKDVPALQNSRLDLISVSGHKVYGPKGIGALVTRRRGFDRVPLTPRCFGGGQERGLRPGTLPVPLVAGLGAAAESGLRDSKARAAKCQELREHMLEAFAPLEPRLNGDLQHMLPHVLNLSFPGLDSEAVMLALKDLVAVSNGSACTSARYSPSHVLAAMGLDDEAIQGAVRFSWCHMTAEPELSRVVEAIRSLR